MTFKTYVD